MGIVSASVLIGLSVAIFIAVRKKWISNETLQTLANVAGVVALLAAIAVFVVPAAGPSETTVSEPPTSESKEPIASPLPGPPSDVQSLIITFNPNPVSPSQGEDGNWIWPFTFKVENPNDFPVEIVAFGNLNECLTNMNSCSYSSSDFASWFTGCSPGSIIIPAKAVTCDNNWWVNFDNPPENEIIGNYAIYFKDDSGSINQSISDKLTLRKP